MLESSPAHCSTPGDAGKDLRREGLAESTSQAAYLALKVILVCFERQLGSQWYCLSLQVKEMAQRKVGGLALWDFLDFIVRTRIPIFVLLRPFIQCKVRPSLSSREPAALPTEQHWPWPAHGQLAGPVKGMLGEETAQRCSPEGHVSC
uniref:Unc-80-like protein, NALCN channel complex subunit n=1 Tax=Pipistrellus kuhlii TaxID=59472 RepID=A0A7J7XX53_PIPKU|nr:unc-80-like protein, NALCN channel complex subunit [Pipistrellus kuhlii]